MAFSFFGWVRFVSCSAGPRNYSSWGNSAGWFIDIQELEEAKNRSTCETHHFDEQLRSVNSD
jgi:hypothetical protein